TVYRKSVDESFSLQTNAVDRSFFEIFTVEFVAGDGENPFPHLMAVAVSDEVAKIMYPDKSALGQRLQLADGTEVEITAVFKSDTHRSSFDYVVLAPIERILNSNPSLDRWTSNGVRTFVLLDQGSEPKRVEASIKNSIQSNLADATVAV